MATLGDLKLSIVTEMVRDDLLGSPQLLLHIQRACVFFSDRRFWFNALVASVSTTGGVADVDIPAFRRVDRVTIPARGVDLRKVQLAQLERVGVGSSGTPNVYASYNGKLRLDPVPDGVYALQITGLANVAPPEADGDTSIWTNEAQDLIRARARFTLYRDLYRDPEGAKLALGATQEELQRLLRETARNLVTPLRAERYRAPASFNILNG